MAMKKTAAPKRAKMRTAAKKSTLATRKKSTLATRKKSTLTTRKKPTLATRKKSTLRKKKAKKVGATAASRKTAKKPAAKKRPVKKIAAKKRPVKKIAAKRSIGTVKKKTVTRKTSKKVAVKKKPSKRKTAKKTAHASRVEGARKLSGIKKKTRTVPKAVRAVQVMSKKKQRQAKSESQATPVVKQQSSLETKMAETKKSNKKIQEEVVSKDTDATISLYKGKPGNGPLNAEQLAYLRGILQQQVSMLHAGTERTVHHLQDEGSSLPDVSDRATQEEEFSLELRARDRDRKLIKKIEHALQQIKAGRYGFCNACDAEIGFRRLEARPTATLCIDCKTLEEIREKQIYG